MLHPIINVIQGAELCFGKGVCTVLSFALPSTIPPDSGIGQPRGEGRWCSEAELGPKGMFSRGLGYRLIRGG
jgi:hypothetical protein